MLYGVSSDSAALARFLSSIYSQSVRRKSYLVFAANLLFGYMSIFVRILPPKCRQAALHRFYSIFAANLLLECSTQILLGFCCQFAVWLHGHICPYFVGNLLSNYVSRFCYIFASILSTLFVKSNSGLNLYPSCQQHL